MCDSCVEEERFSDGDVASDGDADQAVRTDRLQTEVDSDYRRTQPPVTCTLKHALEMLSK